jgi:hypothetical protein
VAEVFRRPLLDERFRSGLFLSLRGMALSLLTLLQLEQQGRSGLFGGACAGKETFRPNASTAVRHVPILSMADGDSLNP